MQAHSSVRARYVREVMRDDHLCLEHALAEILERAYEDDRDELRVAFRALETELRAHLDIEERELLPLFESVSPHEVEQIRAEHALIRSQLDALGLALDVHALRAHAVADFVALLRAHAEREENALYEWADAALSEREKWPLLKWVGARLEERAARHASAASNERGVRASH